MVFRGGGDKHFTEVRSRTRRQKFWEARLLDTKKKKNHGEGGQT